MKRNKSKSLSPLFYFLLVALIVVAGIFSTTGNHKLLSSVVCAALIVAYGESIVLVLSLKIIAWFGTLTSKPD